MQSQAGRLLLIRSATAIALVAASGCGSPRDRAQDNRFDVSGLSGQMASVKAFAPMRAEMPTARPAIGIQLWVNSQYVWETRSIPVCWEPDVPFAPTERAWVQQAVKDSWSAASQLRFTGWDVCTPASKGIRVAVGDYPTRTLGIGNQVNGVQSGLRINFAFVHWNGWCSASVQLRESCLKANAVHEFGHALGFVHEQNRHDTPGSCASAPSGPDGDRILTPWDPGSIMNYCNADRMRKGGVLSGGDKIGVAAIYGQPS